MNPPVPHFDKAIAPLRERAIVSGHDQRHAFGRGKVKKELEHGSAGIFIERPGRFICKQNAGLVHQCSAKGSPLALASGKFLDAVAKPVSQSGKVGELVKASLGGGTVDARSDCGNQAVLFEGQIRNQVMQLEDEANLVPQQPERISMTFDLIAVHRNCAAVGFVEAPEQMEQRALPAAGRAAERHCLARNGFEVYAFQDLNGALVVTLPDVRGPDDDTVRAGHSKRSASTARTRMA
jgi:hypothetical protein